MKVPCIIDIDSSLKFSSARVQEVPTFTRTRCQSNGHWCTTKGGVLDSSEMASLMGFRKEWFDLTDTTDYQLRGMIGNSMSANVLHAVLPRMLLCAGFIDAKACVRMLPDH